jgi:hypothetical protein
MKEKLKIKVELELEMPAIFTPEQNERLMAAFAKGLKEKLDHDVLKLTAEVALLYGRLFPIAVTGFTHRITHDPAKKEEPSHETADKTTAG